MDFNESGKEREREREREHGWRREKAVDDSKQTDISMSRANHRDSVRMLLPGLTTQSSVVVAKQSEYLKWHLCVFFCFQLRLLQFCLYNERVESMNEWMDGKQSNLPHYIVELLIYTATYLKSHLANWMDPIKRLHSMQAFECVIIIATALANCLLCQRKYLPFWWLSYKSVNKTNDTNYKKNRLWFCGSFFERKKNAETSQISIILTRKKGWSKNRFESFSFPFWKIKWVENLSDWMKEFIRDRL